MRYVQCVHRLAPIAFVSCENLRYSRLNQILIIISSYLRKKLREVYKTEKDASKYKREKGGYQHVFVKMLENNVWHATLLPQE